MENPFTTIQNWIDARRAKKNREQYGHVIESYSPSAEEREIAENAVAALRATGPKVGASTTFTYDGLFFKVTVAGVNGDQIFVSAEEIQDDPFKTN